ncbi:DUF1980 domain-containing protein [Paenibacillus sp. sgz302251]|uniref:DUF1980 domain-containing protein n=1 Tax=Paenibacillus sp. sgz302251 TaxID=3414493 RepID=UPI003C7DFF5C
MIHHLIRAAILTGFAMFIVYLDRTGEMRLYIAPHMELYIKLSALGLYAAAIYQVYAALQKRMGKQTPSCVCEQEHEPSSSIFKNILIYSIFIFPLLLGFLVPTGTLGSAFAAHDADQTHTQESNGQQSARAIDLLFPSEDK